jgi:SAM-dependent methyltransferase
MFDLRSVLIYPPVYKLLQNLARRKEHTREYVEKYIKPKVGDVVLDIGCGPADILEFLPRVKYYGFDLSSKYINEAKRRYGDRGEFFCKELSETSAPAGIKFDIVMATNVLHHLNDEEAIKLFKLAQNCLKSGGRLVTCDGCHSKDEGFISRTISNLDRGKYVRDQEGYLSLARQVFNRVEFDIRNDLSNIPVNGIFIICTKY